jgi:hypothetical protein
MLQHRSLFDFKVVIYNDSDHLTFAIGNSPHFESPPRPNDLQLGYITNSAYEVYDKVDVNLNSTIFDMHEFRVIDDGKIALMRTTKVELRDVSEVGVEGLMEKRLANKGFQDIEVATGNINFDWDALSNGFHLRKATTWGNRRILHTATGTFVRPEPFPLGQFRSVDILLTSSQSHQCPGQE